MYSFEGNFRHQPTQSLGGASKGLKAEKSLLLAQAHAKRQSREQFRKESRSALIIQSFYRGAKVREHLKAVERDQFDGIVRTSGKSPANGKKKELLRKLTFFYHLLIDDDRLILVSQLLLEDPSSFVQYVFTQDGSIVLVKKLLSCCCQCIQNRCSSASANISIPLRTVDCFTDSSVFLSTASACEALWSGVCEHVVSHGYFKVLRTLSDKRLPSSIERTSVPPTPLAECVLGLLVRPMMCSFSQSEHHRISMFTSFCAQFFSPAYTHQVYDFILPALASETFRGQAVLSYLIGSVSHGLQPGNACGCSLPTSPTLLHALLFVTSENIGCLRKMDVVRYLEQLSMLFPLLDDHPKSPEHSVPIPSRTELVMECLEKLNSPKHVEALIPLLARAGDPQAIYAVCCVGHTVLAKLQQHVHDTRILYTLCYNTHFMRNLWDQCLKLSIENATGASTPLYQLLINHSERYAEAALRLVPLLSMFCSLFSHSLMSLHDVDFYGDTVALPNSTMPFTLAELVVIAALLRDVCLGIVNLAVPERRRTVESEYLKLLRSHFDAMSEANRAEWIYLFKVTSQLVRHLYDRDTRRTFCPDGHWQSEQATSHHQQFSRICKDGSLLSTQPLEEALDYEQGSGSQNSVSDMRSLVILQELPFVLSFAERVKIFQELVRIDKEQYQIDAIFSPETSINLNLRRTHLYEDAFEKLSPWNEPTLKKKVRVHMLNVAGLSEAGIDGGGLFREFMTDLLKTAFDPNRGFFTYTSSKMLYPNPLVYQLIENYHEHFFFIGRMIGKALYEQMLVELPLASFFLSKLLSKTETVDFHHLASLDPEMYKNLLSLRNYDGDVAELGLDFTVTNKLMDVNKAEDLKSGGREIAVTADNVIEYIHLMADYRLNKQIRNQCIALSKGIEDVISLDWLRMFNPHELQTLLSGAPVPIDVEDLKANTNYSGGYTEEHPVIVNFWKVVSRFDDKKRRLLLKFVTSCSRPPLLGFKDLYPAFCIHHAGVEERLPTSSTCMNLLKLPEYKDDVTLEEKLTYAIESGAGFELS